MKPINFINTLSPQAQQEFYAWHTRSCFALLFLVLVIGIVQSIQLYQLYAARSYTTQLHTKTKKYSSALAKQQKLEHECATIREHITARVVITEQQDVFLARLKALYALNNMATTITSCTLDTQSISADIQCAQPITVLAHINQLQHTMQCPGLKLVSLQPNATRYSAHVQGVLQ